jgi:hypothetical protein
MPIRSSDVLWLDLRGCARRRCWPVRAFDRLSSSVFSDLAPEDRSLDGPRFRKNWRSTRRRRRRSLVVRSGQVRVVFPSLCWVRPEGRGLEPPERSIRLGRDHLVGGVTPVEVRHQPRSQNQ